jgi:hypothetical protein
MKKLSVLLILAFCTIRCTKIPDAAKDTITNKVSISLDYTFPSRSGDMAAKDGPTYLDFYNQYISSKILTPRTYYIMFTSLTLHTGTGINGKWGNKVQAYIPPDRYEIDGYSQPTKYQVWGDTCYLKFHDTIDITKTSTDVTLKALYDCSLILLDTTDVKNTILHADTTKWTYPALFSNTVKKTMMKSGAFYNAFYSNGPANGDGYYKADLYLTVTSRRIDTTYSSVHGVQTIYVHNRTGEIVLSLYTWTPGKYYYFSESDNNYNLSPMISGN